MADRAAAAAAAGQQRPVKLLALHSFRTSAAIFTQQLARSKWLGDVFTPGAFELVFIDAPNPASGKIPRDVAPFFPQGPYYEWVTVERHGDKLCFDDEKMDRSLGAVRDVLRAHAALNQPFDGLVGFSQGTALASTILALQAAGAPLLQDVPPLKFCILFAGFQPKYPPHVDAWRNKIKVPSLHVFGDRDELRPQCKELADAFENAVVIQHTRGHSIPALPPVLLAVARAFLDSAVAATSVVPGNAGGVQRQLTACAPAGSSSSIDEDGGSTKQQEGWSAPPLPASRL